MSDEQNQNRRNPDPGDVLREGVRAVAGVLGALRDAVEQTFEELKEKGDLSPERAKEAARETMRRAQEAAETVRDRLEFVPRREFDELKAQVEALKAEVEAHRAHPTHHTHDTGSGTSA